MPFSSLPLAFHQNLDAAIDSIRRHLSPRRLPEALYHYTSFTGALGIIDSRALWATCVEDLVDQSEIRHGMEIVQAEVQGRQELPRFPQQLLRSLPEVLSARRAWTFVACFRPKPVPNERGPYCLQFETLSDWEPRLRLAGLQSNVRYSRVIYQPSQKRKAIQRAINSIVISAARNSRGDLQGPWAESIEDPHARFAAQPLMNLISSFKDRKFEWEDEWRIVCSPKYSQNLAPDMDDDRFRPLIKGGEEDCKRYVELRLSPKQHGMIVAFPRNEIPFSRILVRDDCAASYEEHQRIREALRDSGRSDIELRKQI
jgi:hypothetical protein